MSCCETLYSTGGITSDRTMKNSPYSIWSTENSSGSSASSLTILRRRWRQIWGNTYKGSSSHVVRIQSSCFRSRRRT